MSNHIGYARVAGPEYRLDAVQWWYYWPYDDGWSFARGGSCRTLREARKLINDCHGIRERERSRFLARSTHILNQDGSLTPIERGYSV